MSIPIPERNPAFHSVGPDFAGSESRAGSGLGGTVDNIFNAVSGTISGIGDVFTSGLDSASRIAGAYNRYDATVNPPQRQGISTQNLLLIGGGILLVVIALK